MLKSRLPQITAEMHGRVTAAVRAGAKAVESEARSRVPVASGDLRDAIHVEQDGDDVKVIAGDHRVFYGHLVEFGTSRTPARPFLIPALESRREAIVDLVDKALKGR